jgi:hypothetical protein
MNAFVRTGKIYIPLIFMLALSLMSACSQSAPTTATQPAVPVPPDRVDVVYFYDSKICQCQIAPGERIRSDLFINFGGELSSGKLTFQSIDLASTDNATIATKYGATSQSLFVNIVRAGKEHIIALPEILLVKDDNEALDRLINNRITRYLAGEE